MKTELLNPVARNIGYAQLTIILTEQQQMVAKMIMIDELSVEEIAERLDLSIGEVLEITKVINNSLEEFAPSLLA